MEFKLGDKFMLKSQATSYVLEEIVKHKDKKQQLLVCNPVDKTFTIMNHYGEEVIVNRQPLKMTLDNFEKILESNIIHKIN